jgi:hypothetical protein
MTEEGWTLALHVVHFKCLFLFVSFNEPSTVADTSENLWQVWEERRGGGVGIISPVSRERYSQYREH